MAALTLDAATGILPEAMTFGHANLGTTEAYIGNPTLDELTAAVEGVTFLDERRTNVLGSPDPGREAREAPTGIEPVQWAFRPAEPDSEDV